jgi:putative hydrolase of the HAD superfamily
MGGTLAYPHPSFHGLIAAVCQEAGIDVSAADAERAEPAVWARIATREDAGRGFTTSPERSRAFWIWVYQAFLAELGYPEQTTGDLPVRLLESFLRLESYRLYEDAIPVLERLRGTSVILGVISNWEDWLEQLIAHLEINRYFDHVILSGTAGVEKPDAAIFHHALDAAGVAPHEAVHVGDSLRDDIQGAAAVGIRPILLDRYDRLLPALWEQNGATEQPITRVRSLLEVPALLGLP